MRFDGNLIIRLDAGNIYGLGHLSRCISLTNEFEFRRNIFLVKSDNISLIEAFMYENIKVPFELISLEISIDIDSETLLISEYCDLGSLLILDHYDANEYYQLRLLQRGIKWLQLDSHAKVGFYADWVMHGSPGATVELYEPLRLRPETEYLLGPKYCIIKEQVRKLAEDILPRKRIDKILICFGGGNDKGATIACLEALQFNTFRNFIFYVAINKSNKYYERIRKLQDIYDIRLIIPENLHLTMKDCDLAIIAPGMISYEAACLGLPMLLVTIADNQIINSESWEKMGCAINIGNVQSLQESINSKILYLKHNPEILQEMSEKCLQLVDGLGIKRIRNQIMK